MTVTASLDAPAMRRVSYADLNLETEAGRKMLNGRIHRAVRFVCGDQVTKELREAREQRECSREARKSAVAQLAALRETGIGSRAIIVAAAR